LAPSRSRPARRGRPAVVAAALASLVGLPPVAALAGVEFHALPGELGLPIVADAASQPPTAVGWMHRPEPSPAYLWTAAGGFVLLADLEGSVERGRAYAISADGRVVVGRGFAGAAEEAVRWVEAGPPEALGAPPGRTVTRSEATAVSGDGAVIAGTATLSSGAGRGAFRWTPALGMEMLGELAPGGFQTSPTAVSQDGSTIVGWGYVPSADGTGSDTAAFRWREGTGFRILSDFPSNAYAADVSADGSTVVGGAGGEAFLWREPTGLVALGELPGSTGSVSAQGVTADGSMVVGESHTSAFIWDRWHGMRSLGEFLATRGADLGDWQLERATAISEDGCVVVGDMASLQYGAGYFLATLPCGTCRNGVDDDGDGLADLGDPGCADPSDIDERSTTRICDDGVDNDFDGWSDYSIAGGGDPGCSSVFGWEISQCQDGIDNDGEAGTDFDGGASLNFGWPFDEPDPQCREGWHGREAQASPRCGLGYELALLAPLLQRLARRRRRATR
jgi:probable HAF family extracellular repeat protein